MKIKSQGLILTTLILVWSFPIMADEEATRVESLPTAFTPWFTGPLIAPSGYTVKAGDFNIEPYLYFYVYNGSYDQHWKPHSTPNFYSTRFQVQAKMGIVQGLDFHIYPQAFYNETQGHHYANIGDLPLGFSIQLLRSGIDKAWPAIKLTLRASVPIGKYQHLHAEKLKTDAIGSGSWAPAVSLVFSKLYHTSERHYLDTRLVFNYQFGTPVHVKGFNSYGGGPRTRGTVHPGNNLFIDGSIQYNMSQRWVVACDLYYIHYNRNKFSGKAGTDSFGAPNVNTGPSGEQLSLAPAIEYNWSKNLGLIGGVWFTLAGRNTSRFVTGVVALNIHI